MPRAKSGSLGIRGGKGKMLARRGRKKKKVVAKKGRTAAEQRAAAARGLSKVRGGDGPKLIPGGETPTNKAVAAPAPTPVVRTPASKPRDTDNKSITRTLANRGAKNIRRPGSEEPTESPSILRGLGQAVGSLFEGWNPERGLRPDRKPVQRHASGGPVRGVGKAIRGHGRGKIV